MAPPFLHLERPDPADARDEVRFGTLNGRRVAVWDGTAPQDIAHEGIPTLLSLEGVEGGDGSYAEAIPSGIRLVEQEPPPHLARYVVTRVLRALAALHDAGLVHGRIDERRVVLGHDGEVVLIGRGRRNGSAGHDVIATIALLPASAEITMPGSSAAQTAEMMQKDVPADGREQLAAWVTRHAPPDSVDEVVPDLGEEHDQTGLLDRYEESVTAAPGVDESADEDSSTQMNVGQTLWRALAAPPVNEAPADRFARVDGTPSAAIAALLARESPLLVGLPAIGPIDTFVVDAPVESDPDLESSNTVKAPLIEIAAAEAAVRARQEAATLPLGSSTPEPAPAAGPKSDPAVPTGVAAPSGSASPLRVVAVVLLVAIAAAAVAVILNH